MALRCDNSDLANEDVDEDLGYQEESLTFRKLAESRRDPKERQRQDLMFMQNRKLVVFLIRQLGYFALLKNCRGVTPSDLIREGELGLMIAISRFDPDKGKLSTYAVYWIRYLVLRYIKKNSGIVPIEKKLQKTVSEFAEAIRSLEIEMTRHPTWEEIQDKLGWSDDQMREVSEAMREDVLIDHIHDGVIGANMSSLATPADQEEALIETDSRLSKLKDLEIAKETFVNSLRMIAARIFSANKVERNVKIFLQYYATEESGLLDAVLSRKTYLNVGQLHGISKERVRQILDQFLEIIRRDVDLMFIMEEFLRIGILRIPRARTLGDAKIIRPKKPLRQVVQTMDELKNAITNLFDENPDLGDLLAECFPD